MISLRSLFVARFENVSRLLVYGERIAWRSKWVKAQSALRLEKASFLTETDLMGAKLLCLNVIGEDISPGRKNSQMA